MKKDDSAYNESSKALFSELKASCWPVRWFLSKNMFTHALGLYLVSKVVDIFFFNVDLDFLGVIPNPATSLYKYHARHQYFSQQDFHDVKNFVLVCSIINIVMLGLITRSLYKFSWSDNLKGQILDFELAPLYKQIANFSFLLACSIMLLFFIPFNLIGYSFIRTYGLFKFAYITCSMAFMFIFIFICTDFMLWKRRRCLGK